MDQNKENIQAVTTLDVLENFFGELPHVEAVHSLNPKELDELGELVVESSQSQLNDPAPENTYYPGGWLGGNWQYQALRGDLNLALLYYPRILVHDPLAEFFFQGYDSIPEMRQLRARQGGMSISGGADMWGRQAAYVDMREDLDKVRNFLGPVIEYMVGLAPLFRDSVLVARPQWQTILSRWQPIMASVRHDVRDTEMQDVMRAADESDLPVPVWDNIRGLTVVPHTGWRESDRPWQSQYAFFYLAKTLAIADRVGATYVPPAESDLTLLRTKLRVAGRKASIGWHPHKLLEEVARILLPDLQLSARTAVNIRKSDEEFDSWRRHLSKVARDGKGDSPEELRARVEDELIPIVRRVRDSTSRSQALRKTLKEQAATAVLTGGPAATAAGLSGGKPLITTSAIAAGGILQWIWKAYRPPALGGTDAVIASLVRAGDQPSGPPR